MSANQWVMAFLLTGATALAGISGCGGSRNSSDSDDDTDFALGEGDATAMWTSDSTELVYNRGRGDLYYLDVEGQDVVAVDVASGDDAPLVAGGLLFGPSKIRLTADNEELYILESEESANDNDGFPRLIRYDIAGNFALDVARIDEDAVVDDFVPTNSDRVVLATHVGAVSSTPVDQHLTLINAIGGAEIDSHSFSGFTQALALSWDQATVLDQVTQTSSLSANTVSIASDAIDVRGTGNLTLAQSAVNTYEPEGERIFRSNGTVWDDDEEISLGSGYESIDFDLDDARVITLVESGSNFIVRYFDLDSLELLSEQTLPAVADAAGMEPVKLFVDGGNLYVVYREVTSGLTRDYVLVEFDYPN